jgi:exopolysaccharide biosynthesis polyprenyl glycosylphosphotransferase
MLRRFSPLLLVVQFFVDLALTLVAAQLADQLRLHIVTGFERREQYVAIQPWVYLLILAVWSTFFLVLGVFDARRKASLVVDLTNLWLSVTISTMVLASLFYLLGLQQSDTPSRLFFAYFYAADLVLVTIAHVAAFQILASLRRRGRHVRRVLLVGGGVRGRHVAIRLRGREAAGLALIGYLHGGDDDVIPGLDLLGDLQELPQVVRGRQVDEVVMALPAELHNDALRLTSELQDLDVVVRVSPDVFEMVAMKARIEDFYGLPLISIGEPSITPLQAHVKRAFDLVLGGMLLVLMSPFMLVIALLVALDSRGPILFHQRRVGAGGHPFYMHKFRSMQWDPASIEGTSSKHRGDARVTRIGKFIRRTSLDELPQLWNVVKGEMSLVGPRPELPSIVDAYEPWQRKRFAVPPGMTGWWQVNGRAERSMHLNTEIDLYYIQNYSILLDVQILLRTLGAVIRGRGAF